MTDQTGYVRLLQVVHEDLILLNRLMVDNGPNHLHSVRVACVSRIRIIGVQEQNWSRLIIGGGSGRLIDSR